MMATAASAALDYTLPQMPRVHEKAQAVAKELEAVGYKISIFAKA